MIALVCFYYFLNLNSQNSLVTLWSIDYLPRHCNLCFVYHKGTMIIMVERLSTGIKGFDELISGGLPAESIVLITGGPGTGKSIFCQQILINNAKKGKKSVYISFEQTVNDILNQMNCFDWQAQELIDRHLIEIIALSSENRFLEKISGLQADLFVVDSLTTIVTTPLNIKDMGQNQVVEIQGKYYQVPLNVEDLNRNKVKNVLDLLKRKKAVSLAISEMVENAPGLSRDTISEFFCDGVVILKHTPIGQASNRSLQVRKMRCTKIHSKTVSFDFTNNGIVIDDKGNSTWSLK